MATIISKSVIDINLEALEQEWLEQPKQVLSACERLAKAKRKHEEAKANLDLVCAKCGLKVRKMPKKFGVLKVSEAALKQAVEVMPAVQEATNLVIKARYIVDNIQALVTALEHRKKALENAVYLWGAGYFSTPSTHKMAKKRNVREIGD